MKKRERERERQREREREKERTVLLTLNNWEPIIKWNLNVQKFNAISADKAAKLDHTVKHNYL